MKGLIAIITMAASMCGPGKVEPTTCQDAIRAAFSDTPVVATMLRVSTRESGNDPTARNGSHRGCLQINTTLHAGKIRAMGWTAVDMLRPTPNALIGRWLYNQAGTSPWAATR